GEVSVQPYSSNIFTPAAKKILAKRGCKAALPEAIALTSPPNASCHLEKINFLAIANLKLYHGDIHFTSYCSANSTAQNNNLRLTPVSSSPFAMILSNTFSNKRGTAVKTCGLTSLMFSPIVSIDSAK